MAIEGASVHDCMLYYARGTKNETRWWLECVFAYMYVLKNGNVRYWYRIIRYRNKDIRFIRGLIQTAVPQYVHR